jgi:hypothetical protein
VSFAYLPHGEGLVVRVDTFVGARFARTVLVPRDATSVTIRRTERSFTPHAGTHRTVRTVTGPSAVADLVRLVDRLPGAMTVPFVTSCPEMLSVRSYRLVFATPHGSYVASLPTTACWPQVTLRHGGVRAGPPLDPGRRFAPAVEKHLR